MDQTNLMFLEVMKLIDELESDKLAIKFVLRSYQNKLGIQLEISQPDISLQPYNLVTNDIEEVLLKLKRLKSSTVESNT